MNWNILAAIVVLVAACVIIGIKLYKRNKSAETRINFDEFIETYGDHIIELLKDVIVILQINAKDFESKEEYEKCIISVTIEKLRETASEFSIDTDVIEIINIDTLTEIIYAIFKNNLIDIFSVLSPEDIESTPKIYEDTVVEALTTSTIG